MEMNESVRTEVNRQRNSGERCERTSVGTTTGNESNVTASSVLMVQKGPQTIACNNNRSLCILEELNRIYEERLNDIDQQTDGNYELKYITYKEWVEMLLKLMRDLMDVVEEIEYEASSRIDLLEKKLQSETVTACHTNDVSKLRNDVSNLIELIRRALEGSWKMDGLNFYTIKLEDIFGTNSELSDSSSVQTCPMDSPRNNDETVSSTNEDEVFKACISELKDCLREKEVQLADKLKQNECLQTELRLYKSQAAQKDKVTANMRALAFEVADKHDQIVELRDQMNSIEEELKKAHKKVQFKDNVIKELRREIKNATKSEDSPRSCICTSGRRPESDTENKSFKSVTFTNLECTQRTDYSINTMMDQDMAKLGNSLSDEEDKCIQILKEELDGLLKYQSCHSAAIEDQQARLKEFIYKMLSDLTKNRKRLSYMRTRLLEMICPKDPSVYSPKQQDSGYISPEEMENECHLIDSVQYQINEIKAENDTLKEKLRKSNTDMMSRNSSICDRCMNCDNSEKVLQEVASALSNLCGENIPYDMGSIAFDAHDRQVHPICQAMMNLENDLNEKNRTICNSNDLLNVKECEVKKLKEELTRLELELNAKSLQIDDLQSAVDVHINSIDRLKTAKDNVETELAGFKRMAENSDYQLLLGSHKKLQIECQHQLTTINNLRQALEVSKKSESSQQHQQQSSGNSPPVVSAPTNINLSNPLWGWWRNSNVHDI